MEAFSYQHALILGAGESGIAMARWCGEWAHSICIADTRASFIAAISAQFSQAVLKSGPFTLELLVGIDWIGLSPGLSPYAADLAALLAQARALSIPVWSEIECFAQVLCHLAQTQAYHPRLLGITGTNGKTTVTELVGHLCGHAGKNVQIVGNIGLCALAALRQCVYEKSLPQIWVLELSSFQLATTEHLYLDAATILNIASDHLDWHRSLEDYRCAKKRIFLADITRRILNRADIDYISLINPSALSFGLDVPQRCGDFGVITQGEEKSLADLIIVRRNAQGKLDSLIAASELPILGHHYLMNVMAACALLAAIELPLAPLIPFLPEYKGAPHRIQWVNRIEGVDFYDDSKGTNVAATIAALQALSDINSAASNQKSATVPRIILIAGGDAKAQDLTPLYTPLKRWVKALFLIGRDAQRFYQLFHSEALPCYFADSLQKAILDAFTLARSGECVLLSPACASFDMFANYQQRGLQFCQTVQQIADKKVGYASA